MLWIFTAKILTCTHLLFLHSRWAILQTPLLSPAPTLFHAEAAIRHLPRKQTVPASCLQNVQNTAAYGHRLRTGNVSVHAAEVRRMGSVTGEAHGSERKEAPGGVSASVRVCTSASFSPGKHRRGRLAFSWGCNQTVRTAPGTSGTSPRAPVGEGPQAPRIAHRADLCVPTAPLFPAPTGLPAACTGRPAVCTGWPWGHISRFVLVHIPVM